MRWPISALATAMLLAPVAASAVSARRVATGFDHPVFAAAPPGDTRLFVVEQTGRIRVVSNVANGTVLETPFLDLSTRFFIGDFHDDESGLLGLAFAPDYASSGLFYVQYAESGFFPPGDVVVARFSVGADPNEADPISERLIFRMAKPASQSGTSESYHNGGTVAFGPDGKLWVPTGDGGGWFGNDPNNCAQNAGSPLGKLLRITLASVPLAGVTVPAGAACPQLAAGNGIEIWARGLRNPFRTSFDRETGDLYIADVGQDAREEVNVLAASALAAGSGPNFGWRAFEGTVANSAVCPGDALCSQVGSTRLPVYDYAHVGNDCEGSITGGFVYRGPDPSLAGQYFFADFCQGFVKSFVWNGSTGITNLTDRTAELAPDAGSIDVVTGFGEGGGGELYLVDWLDGELFAVPEPASTALTGVALAALLGLTRSGRSAASPRPG